MVDKILHEAHQRDVNLMQNLGPLQTFKMLLAPRNTTLSMVGISSRNFVAVHHDGPLLLYIKSLQHWIAIFHITAFG